jgi:cytochrome c-type biogenesis protein CcmE
VSEQEQSMSDELDPTGPVEVNEADREDQGLSPLVKVGVVFAALAGAVSLMWFSSSADDAFVYSKLVDEVLAEPETYHGRELRVEGDLKQGSIQFRERPCEWRFVLSSQGKEMPVSFPQCIVPDTFKDGMGLKVTVQGKLLADGSFDANQVIPRCPSKYEMQQKLEAGETMPHAMPGQPGAAMKGPLDPS